MRLRRTSAVLALGLVAVGCDARDPGRTVVAVVGETAISLADLEAYFDSNLAPVAREEEGPTPREMDSVRSRLLDALIDEALLALEAERRGLAVDERDIDQQLELEAAEAGTPDSPGDGRGRTRRRLAAQALQESIAATLSVIDDAELEAYIADNPESTRHESRLVLRGLTFPSIEDASRVREEIVQGRESFSGAVSHFATSESDGVPIEIAWLKLPEVIRDALGNLEPQRVSPAVEYEGHAFLFEIAAWLTRRPENDAARLARAREDLTRLRRSWAIEALLQKLRARTTISIRRSQLPFRYRESS